MWSVVRLRSQRSTPHLKKSQNGRRRKLERQFGSQPPTKNKFLRSIYWALRACQYWLCFYDNEIEVDVEDILSNPFNTQPPSLNSLRQRTGFDKKWLMFMYRNFKQKCANGRMTRDEWRSIFRTAFPYAVNFRFADRLYYAISTTRGHSNITFEDLVISLWELTEGAVLSDQQQQSDVSFITAFVFSMLEPDPKGRVDEVRFYDYVQSIFDLCSCTREDSTIAFGSSTANLNKRMTGNETYQISPNVREFASKRFRMLDTDRDGFITINDIERELSSKRGIALMSNHDIEKGSNKKTS